MKIYNSLTKNIEEINTYNTVGYYHCGPTPYQRSHIGNLYNAIMSDMVYRVLTNYIEVNVDWVFNITDIDDKLILQAQKEGGEIKDTLKSIVNKNVDVFYRDLEKLNIDYKKTKKIPLATDYITEMQDIITNLLEKEIAYISDDGIYFNMQSYIDKGHKYGLLKEVEFNENKKSLIDEHDKAEVHDFALWKFVKNDSIEPSWEYIIDNSNYPGRPGWHIECSAMSTTILGSRFELHSGGQDLMFPHHENEIAQLEGSQSEKYIHFGLVSIAGKKMSKRLNNILYLNDLPVSPIHFRFFSLLSSYRSGIDYTEKGLKDAKLRYERINDILDVLINNEELPRTDLSEVFEESLSPLNDDFNFSKALSNIESLFINNKYDRGLLELVERINSIFGLNFNPEHKTLSLEQSEKLEQRIEAKNEKNFVVSDSLRDDLLSSGIEVIDSEHGQLYY